MKKLQITLPGKRLVVETEDGAAERYFAEFARQLLQAAPPMPRVVEALARTPVAVPAVVERAAAAEDTPEVVAVQKVAEVAADAVDDADEVPEVWENPEFIEPARPAYTGFLYIKCAKCGEARGFCAKTPMASYRCRDCGCHTDLTMPLRKMYVNCECGKQFRYLTNETDELFDASCVDCGAPVTLSFNAKRKIYETLGREG